MDELTGMILTEIRYAMGLLLGVLQRAVTNEDCVNYFKSRGVSSDDLNRLKGALIDVAGAFYRTPVESTEDKD